MTNILPKQLVATSNAPDAALYIIRDAQGENVILQDVLLRRKYKESQCGNHICYKSDCREPTREQLFNYVTRAEIHRAIKDSLAEG